MQQVKTRVAAMVCLAGVVAALHAVPARAQSIQVKPGLWATATNGTVNGKKLPTLFDIQGALPAEQRAAITAAMAQAGLPAGWNPSLHCQRSDAYVLQRTEALKGCTTQVTPDSATAGTVTLACTGDATGKGRGTYKVVGGTAATVQWTVEAVVQGRPLKLEQTMQSRWIGPACSKPPAGLDPEMVQTDE